MPKIPQVLADPAGLGRRAVPRDFGGGEGMEALGQAVGGIGDMAGELFEQEMSANVSGSVAEASRALNDLSMEVQANPDHNARNKMYADGASKIARELREGLRYPKFQGMFDERLEGSLERGRVGIAQGVRRSQVESITANRLRAINEGKEVAASMDEQSRGVYLDENVYPVIAEGTGPSWTGGQAETLRQSVDNYILEKTRKDAAMDIVDDLMRQDLTVPEMRQRVDSIEDRGLRDEVRQRLEMRVTTRENNEARSQSALFQSEYYRVLSGGYKDRETLRDEFADNENLDPTNAEYLLEVAEAREAGVTLPATVSTVNDLREKIVNREIRHASGLFPYLHEIGDNFTNLDALITKMNSAEAREIEKASEEFLKMARVTLVKSTLNFVDAAGEESFFEFQDWFLRQRDERLKDIKDHTARLTVVREMVNPNNPQTEEGGDYAGNHIKRFSKTVDEQLTGTQNMWGVLAPKAVDAPVIAPDEVGTPVISVPTPDGNEVQVPIPQRMPGESIDEFMARQAINALVPPVPEDSQVEAE